MSLLFGLGAVTKMLVADERKAMISLFGARTGSTDESSNVAPFLSIVTCDAPEDENCAWARTVTVSKIGIQSIANFGFMYPDKFMRIDPSNYFDSKSISPSQP